MNPAGLKIAGYAAEELIGKSYLDLIPLDHRETVERFYGIQFVKRLPITYYEFPLVTKQGETVWLGQNAQLLTEDEAVVGFQAIARDITDRKRAEAALGKVRCDTRISSIMPPMVYILVISRAIIHPGTRPRLGCWGIVAKNC